MSRWSAIRLVAGREITERVASRMLRITTVVLVVVVAAGVIVPSLVHGSGSATRIGLVGTGRSLRPTLVATARATRQRVTVSSLADDATARAALTHGAIDVAVTSTSTGARITADQSLSASTRSLIALTVAADHQRQVLTRAGLPAATIRAAQTPPAISTVVLHPPPSREAARDVAAIAAALLLYLTLGVYGGAVASGVAQEKTSRTAEVLLACLRPSDLLAGKVLGIGLCGLGQLTITAAAGLVANLAVHSASIPSTVWALLPASVMWFALGFALFAFAFAAAGAMVARQEEVQISTGPFALPLLAGYLLVYAVIDSPHATWLRVLSFVPPLSPSLMPARIATGTVSWWAVLVSVLLTLGAIALTARIAGGIYRAGLVRGGARLTWRQALSIRQRRRAHAG